ncbi:glycosyltransferase family 2 protein [Pseudanabaenaceae cyanobacterium LEGE 13415]|nr:glycosyltransferase family 2 protein [Pseudanabaenaceae cyanobacterium LEGE 13415]
MWIFSASLTGLVGVLLGWSIWTGLETVFALIADRSNPQGGKNRETERIAVLIPAHNEEAGLEITLSDIVPQLQSGDRLIVVADNCTDATAEIARQQGAIVLEREDLTQRGKGYALDYGLRYLADEPPDVVIVIDADCRIEPAAIATLTQTAIEQNRPVQATYLMQKPAQPSAKDSVSAFAFTMKNLVRPLGLWRLGLPCLLTGTGMAFPWATIQAVNFASGHLVEDMKLSVDLTIAGYPPVYCPAVQVIGTLPQQQSATQSQRTRWEHGHLQSILLYVPALIKAAIKKLSLAAIVLAIELSVPPLSLFVMSWMGVSAIALLWGVFTGFWIAGIFAIVAGTCLIATVLAAWSKFGRKDLPLKELLAIPFYIVWKIPVYLRFLTRPQQAWIRTARD